MEVKNKQIIIGKKGNSQFHNKEQLKVFVAVTERGLGSSPRCAVIGAAMFVTTSVQPQLAHLLVVGSLAVLHPCVGLTDPASSHYKGRKGGVWFLCGGPAWP